MIARRCGGPSATSGASSGHWRPTAPRGSATADRPSSGPATRRLSNANRPTCASCRPRCRQRRHSTAAPRAAERRLDTRRGRIGIFPFSYYTLFEEQLRPLEIDASATPARHDCVFPSQDTITSGTFPLARPLLITVTKQGLRRREVQAFLTAYLAGAQRLASDAGLVPLTDARIRTQQRWLDGSVAPPVVSYPVGAKSPAPRRRTPTQTTPATPTTPTSPTPSATPAPTGTPGAAGVVVPPQD